MMNATCKNCGQPMRADAKFGYCERESCITLNRKHAKRAEADRAAKRRRIRIERQVAVERDADAIERNSGATSQAHKRHEKWVQARIAAGLCEYIDMRKTPTPIPQTGETVGAG